MGLALWRTRGIESAVLSVAVEGTKEKFTQLLLRKHKVPQAGAPVPAEEAGISGSS
jgi:hypothetical protein